jgi:hypothetical protein
MGKSQVEYQLPTTILNATSKNATFNSDQFPINNNKSITISLHTSASSSLSCVAKIQGSHDGSTWFDVSTTSATISGNDDVYWTLSQLESLMFVRVRVTFTTGSAIFMIIARGA